MKIAICDDLSSDIKHLSSLVDKTDIDTEVHCFDSSALLLEAHNSGACFDVIFLDIQMPEPNGFVAAQTLKTSGCEALIIFVTVTDDYVFDGYEVAWRYVPKPISFEKVSELLHRAEIARSIKIVEMQTTEGPKLVRVKDISFIEANRNYVQINTQEAQYRVYTTMHDIETLIDSIFIARPHSSYFVNLNNVAEVEASHLVMDDGRQIPLARGRKADFWNAYRNFVRSMS